MSSIELFKDYYEKERKTLDKIQTEARKELGTEETSAIIFDFNVPSKYGYNYAIGTLNSFSALPFIKFLKDVSSISKIGIVFPALNTLFSPDIEKR